MSSRLITYEDIEKVNNKLKTIDIKGKDYVEVNERIKAFRMIYPDGFIKTKIWNCENGVIIMQAEVGYHLFHKQESNDEYFVDNEIVLGTGTAYEKEDNGYINKTSYIENCETSAVGRALGMAVFGINDSVASANEVINAINNQKVSIEEAENYILPSGKHQGKHLREVPESYLHWLYENNLKMKPYIDALGILMSDEELDESADLIIEIMELVEITHTDLDEVKDKYKIDSLQSASIKTLEEIKERLVKAKDLLDKVK